MIKLKKVGKSLYEIPKENGMKVKGFAFINDRMARSEETHEALTQLKNVSYLPGIIGFVAAMPDIHYGYGFPIGGVAATDIENGVISPGGVGYDINCGVRIIKTNFLKKDIFKKLKDLLTKIYNNVPVGVGSKGNIKLSKKDEKKVVQEGSLWAVKNGFGEESDIEDCENYGRLENANFSDVSNEARERGKEQLGTLGAGNHFLEISYVSKIFDKEAADVFGVFENQIVVLFHTGSRGFGHQICGDYLKKMRNKRLFELPDPELTSIYINDRLGKEYISAMKAAANFAWANRQILTHLVRNGFENFFNASYRSMGMQVLYDVSHNIARFERHVVDGKKLFLCVHRKGATRSFPKGSKEIPEKYRGVGQPVLIPGDMGRASYILKGEKGSMQKSFGTACHGAGRVLSRRKAVKKAKGRNLYKELEEMGVAVLSKSQRTLKEEMPEAYKDVTEIVDIVEENQLAKKVVKLIPIGVIKG